MSRGKKSVSYLTYLGSLASRQLVQYAHQLGPWQWNTVVLVSRVLLLLWQGCSRPAVSVDKHDVPGGLAVRVVLRLCNAEIRIRRRSASCGCALSEIRFLGRDTLSEDTTGRRALAVIPMLLQQEPNSNDKSISTTRTRTPTTNLQTHQEVLMIGMNVKYPH